MLYLAPLQGFTDYIFRETFSKNFEGIDVFFIPYISLKNNKLIQKQLKEILPDNNLQQKVIPQILFKNFSELKELSKIISDYGYNEINLNLGCPYPMVTNRGKGSGLLPHPEKIEDILNCILKDSGINYSVKLRSGLKEEEEIFPVIEVLNSFKLTEIIYHPRLASQLYKGKVNDELALEVIKRSKHRIVLNGDINSTEDYYSKKKMFFEINRWMLGRGILMNPFLAEEINGIYSEGMERINRLSNFHDELYNLYSQKLSGEGHLLIKMKQFWEYFSFVFKQQHKVFKRIRKSSSVAKYLNAVEWIFNEG